MTDIKTDFVGVCNIIGRDCTNLFWVKNCLKRSFVNYLNRNAAYYFHLRKKVEYASFLTKSFQVKDGIKRK